MDAPVANQDIFYYILLAQQHEKLFVQTDIIQIKQIIYPKFAMTLAKIASVKI